MTLKIEQDEVLRMAREAGGYPAELPNGDAWLFDDNQQLERFAAIVAAHEREKCFDAAMKAAEKAVDTALLLEREACAKVCDARTGEPGWCCADAIRARKEK